MRTLLSEAIASNQHIPEMSFEQASLTLEELCHEYDLEVERYESLQRSHEALKGIIELTQEGEDFSVHQAKAASIATHGVVSESVSLEEASGVLDKIWQAIKNAFKKIQEVAEKLFSFLTGSGWTTRAERAEKNKEKIKVHFKKLRDKQKEDAKAWGQKFKDLEDFNNPKFLTPEVVKLRDELATLVEEGSDLVKKGENNTDKSKELKEKIDAKRDELREAVNKEKDKKDAPKPEETIKIIEKVPDGTKQVESLQKKVKSASEANKKAIKEGEKKVKDGDVENKSDMGDYDQSLYNSVMQAFNSTVSVVAKSFKETGDFAKKLSGLVGDDDEKDDKDKDDE